jgi:hypothetical protein
MRTALFVLLSQLAACAGPTYLVATRTVVLAPVPVVQPAPTLSPDRAMLLLRDSFDTGPSAPSRDFGLNVALPQRQRGAFAPATYTLLPGVWYDAPPAAAETVSAGPLEPSSAVGRLWFHGYTAVRMDRAFILDNAGTLQLTARIDPVANDTASQGWVSLIVTPVRDALGWVLDPHNAMGFLVRSNGEIGLSSLGREAPHTWQSGPPARAMEYTVSLTLRAEQDGVRVYGRVNEASFTAVLSAESESALRSGVYLNVGAHYHEGDVQLSSVGELSVFGSTAQ